jgi:hypothetical protein
VRFFGDSTPSGLGEVPRALVDGDEPGVAHTRWRPTKAVLGTNHDIQLQPDVLSYLIPRHAMKSEASAFNTALLISAIVGGCRTGCRFAPIGLGSMTH